MVISRVEEKWRDEFTCRVEDGRGFRFLVAYGSPFELPPSVRLTMTPFPIPQYVVAEYYFHKLCRLLFISARPTLRASNCTFY